MFLSFKKQVLFPRRSLSVFNTVSVMALLIISGLWGLLALFTQDNITLLVNALVVWGIARLVSSGLRRAPLVGSLLCSLTLYVFVFQATFPLYHLVSIRNGYGSSTPWIAYLFFIVMVILFWCMLLAVISGIAAITQHSSQQKPESPSWFGFAQARLLGLLLGIVLIGIFATASTQVAASTTNAGSFHSASFAGSK